MVLNFSYCREYEGEDKVVQIRLPEADPAAFDLSVEWTYYRGYTVKPTSTKSETTINIHAKCCVLGDKLDCSGFMNYAMNCLYSQHTLDPQSHTINYV